MEGVLGLLPENSVYEILNSEQNFSLTYLGLTLSEAVLFRERV